MDLIVLTRGGGSLEDLIGFNNEAVVRQIFGSKIPIVSAIGHEGDWSLTDLVADLRASTPSNAAELIVPDRNMIDEIINSIVQKSKQNLMYQIQTKNNQAELMIEKLNSNIRLLIHEMKQLIAQFGDLSSRISEKIVQLKDRGLSLIRILSNLNPQTILQRGFSITTTDDGKIIKSINELKNQDIMKTTLKDGKISSIVKAIHK